jgi:hypothetical protein
MKKLIFVLFSIIFYTSVLAQSEGKTQVLKPSGYQKEVAIIVDGKVRNYFKLSAERSSLIKIKGPGKLRLISRACFTDARQKTVSYEIQYSLNGSAYQGLKVKSVTPSKRASYVDKNLGNPAQFREFEINIPRGNNTIDFKLPDNSISVAVRYLYNSKKEKKLEWIVLSPKQSAEIVDLVTNESITTYYRFTQDKPMLLEVFGPTQIRVFIRPEFNYQMRGSVNYRIQVKNNGNVINTFQLSNRRSEVTFYKNQSELIPGKASEFVVDVPSGKQSYEFYLLDKDKPSVLGRTMILKKDITNSSN